MPARTGLSSISFVEPIFPSPSARSVPRWRWDWPIWLLICVSLSLGIRAHLLGDHGPERQDLADPLATRLRDFLGAAQLLQRDLGRLQHVDRVRRPERLREHVVDAAQLEHRADAAAGDDAGTRRGRAQQDARRVELAERLVRDRLAVLRDGKEVLLRVVDGLRDGERNLARLPVADADAVDLVADHDKRGEREPPAALDDLGDAIDLDHALLELSGLCDVNTHCQCSLPEIMPRSGGCKASPRGVLSRA